MKRMPPRAFTLFEAVLPEKRETLRLRLEDFARVVARRHKRDRGDLAAMLVALRGYYGTLDVCSRGSLPPLDDEAVAAAVAAYSAATGRGVRRPAA